MKLLRYGPPGAEKPGLLDATGTLRDLSAHVDDIAGDTLAPDHLARLAALDPATLPAVDGTPRLGPPVGRIGKPAEIAALTSLVRFIALECCQNYPFEHSVWSAVKICLSKGRRRHVTCCTLSLKIYKSHFLLGSNSKSIANKQSILS